MGTNLLANLIDNPIALIILGVLGLIICIRTVISSFSLKSIDAIFLPKEQVNWHSSIKTVFGWFIYYSFLILISWVSLSSNSINILVEFCGIISCLFTVFALILLGVLRVFKWKKSTRETPYQFVNVKKISSILALSFMSVFTFWTCAIIILAANLYNAFQISDIFNFLIIGLMPIPLFSVSTNDIPKSFGIKKMKPDSFKTILSDGTEMFLIKCLKNDMLVLGDKSTEEKSEHFKLINMNVQAEFEFRRSPSR